VMANGQERLSLMHHATRLMLAYVPYIAQGHPYVSDLSSADVSGHFRHPFSEDWWRYVSVEAGLTKPGRYPPVIG